jgi:glycosyltransferase involved in cell wall biosynthesis
MLALEIAFWASVGLLAYTHAGYPLLLAVLSRLRAASPAHDAAPEELPAVTLAVAAHDEEDVIAAWVAQALALDYPRERLEVVVACDGCTDATAARAREAGADRVLELDRGGKVTALNAAVAATDGEVLAFSDANASWQPDALRRLVARLVDPALGYVCGQVRFTGAAGAANQEGLYWRYEMALRGLESRLASVTGGNGAIYATRRASYIEVDPIMGHDLSFPFNMVKRGWRALYAPDARASEKMVPSIEGELARKRRMMSHGWPIVLRGGLLSPKGYGPLYALMILSHRVLRYATPFLHLIVLIASLLLLTTSWVYAAAVALQCALVGTAVLARWIPWRGFLVARYYVLTQAALAAGLWDWRRHGTEAGWSPPEGTR